MNTRGPRLTDSFPELRCPKCKSTAIARQAKIWTTGDDGFVQVDTTGRYRIVFSEEDSCACIECARRGPATDFEHTSEVSTR